MGITVHTHIYIYIYSFLWVLQDLCHQPYDCWGIQGFKVRGLEVLVSQGSKHTVDGVRSRLKV